MIPSLKRKTVTALTAIVLTSILGFFSTHCQKIEPERLILVKTSNYDEVTLNSCKLTGMLNDLGENGVSEHGFFISLTSNRADSSPPYNLGKAKQRGQFSKVVDGLTPGTTYHVWAFASNGNEVSYGEPISFKTHSPTTPVVETGEVISLTPTSAEIACNVLSDGGATITERGICWDPNPNPTKDKAWNAHGTGTGEFTGLISNLTPGETYYARTYASNSAGTEYGNELLFSTLQLPVAPTVVTFEVTDIEPTAASSGGSISSDGGSPVLSRGLCWSSTNIEPTLANDYLEYGGGSEPFNMEISGLTHYTTYYVRAYATNETGTGYGEPIEFRTLFLCGSQLVDTRDGQTYFTVSIGDQCWMAENLNVGEIVAISTGQSDNATLEKYCYADEEVNCDQYGGQYTWDEMMQYTLIESAQGVCPAGWHIPSDYEWKVLERTLGMTVTESDGTQWRGSDEGGQLKSGGTTFWNPPNAGATNSTLFSALPAGMTSNNGNSSGIKDFAVFWTSTPMLETQAWYRYLHTDDSRIYRVDGFRLNTTSVRCVKD